MVHQQSAQVPRELPSSFFGCTVVWQCMHPRCLALAVASLHNTALTSPSPRGAPPSSLTTSDCWCCSSSLGTWYVLTLCVNVACAPTPSSSTLAQPRYARPRPHNLALNSACVFTACCACWPAALHRWCTSCGSCCPLQTSPPTSLPPTTTSAFSCRSALCASPSWKHCGHRTCVCVGRRHVHCNAGVEWSVFLRPPLH